MKTMILSFLTFATLSSQPLFARTPSIQQAMRSLHEASVSLSQLGKCNFTMFGIDNSDHLLISGQGPDKSLTFKIVDDMYVLEENQSVIVDGSKITITTVDKGEKSNGKTTYTFKSLAFELSPDKKKIKNLSIKESFEEFPNGRRGIFLETSCR